MALPLTFPIEKYDLPLFGIVDPFEEGAGRFGQQGIGDPATGGYGI